MVLGAMGSRLRIRALGQSAVACRAAVSLVLGCQQVPRCCAKEWQDLHQHRSADDGIRAEVVMTQREWQYNGVAPMREILDWCHQYLDQSRWHYPGWETLVFRDDCAWMMFALRWQ